MGSHHPVKLPDFPGKEWSLSLNAANEADMYHFVTMLRQAARMDIYEQAWRAVFAWGAWVSPRVLGKGGRVGLLGTRASVATETLRVESQNGSLF